MEDTLKEDADMVISTQQGKAIELFLYDNRLLLYPVPECIPKMLTVWEKELKKDKSTNWVTKVVRSPEEYFAWVVRDGKKILLTYQGFLDRVLKALLKEGVPFHVTDMRLSSEARGFPKPCFEYMYGFRFSQEELVRKFLSQGRSGLLGAPTRFGKTSMLVNTLRAFPTLPTVVTAPGVDLVRQLYEDITDPEKGIRGREVKLICSGSRTKFPSERGITVCSADSLDKCDYGRTELLIADEPHALVTRTRIDMVDAFRKARRYGFGATLTGRFDNRDLLIEGVFGPVLVERTYKEAVAEGAICPLTVLFLKVHIQPGHYGGRDTAYDKLLFKSPSMANLTKRICEEVIPEDWQTLIFIKHEQQADLYLDKIGHQHTLAMAKKMSKAEREDVTERMRRNEIKRCLCTRIYVQGVTFSDVRVLINAEAGGNNTSAIQKPGRLAEIRPGKKCGVVIDFLFVPADEEAISNWGGEGWTALCADSKSRMKAYRDKGYDIQECVSLEALKEAFEKCR